MEVAAASFRS